MTLTLIKFDLTEGQKTALLSYSIDTTIHYIHFKDIFLLFCQKRDASSQEIKNMSPCETIKKAYHLKRNVCSVWVENVLRKGCHTKFKCTNGDDA
jgi:hypothetical protein